MNRLLIALGALAFAEPALAAEPAPIEVMVIGTYHFDNPGRDAHNMKAEDVLTPKRQKDLETLASELARFRPTKIAVEVSVETPGLADTGYTKFVPAQLAEDRNEITQIGYRLAHRLGHKTVYAIDEHAKPGGPDYFPMGPLQDYVEAKGRAGEMAALSATIQDKVSKFEAKQKTASIAAMLAEMNEPSSALNEHRSMYYGMLRFGDASAQPGADLNGGWYLRNAKIFSKLLSVVQPGDRVLILYGNGHAYWLRHFATETPGMKLADPMPYLRAAAAKP
jgi:hypothetical protein